MSTAASTETSPALAKISEDEFFIEASSQSRATDQTSAPSDLKTSSTSEEITTSLFDLFDLQNLEQLYLNMYLLLNGLLVLSLFFVVLFICIHAVFWPIPEESEKEAAPPGIPV